MTRLTYGALAIVAICGGGCSAGNNNGGTTGGTTTSTTGGTTGSTTGGTTGGTTGSTGGTTGGMPNCMPEGSACMFSGTPGLCTQGNCGGCTDGTDDAACAAAYGAGTLCAGGACIKGCHQFSDCMPKICDPGSNSCQACTQDSQCPASLPFCDVTGGGNCVATQPACTNNTACNGGFCCAGVCIQGATCCGADATPCTGTNPQCSNNQCTSSLCTDPTPTMKVYVNPNPAANMSGKGSMQCPYKDLHVAIVNAPSPAPAGYTICTTGTFNNAADKFWPRNLHKNVELDGTYCANDGSHTTFTVPAANSGVFATDGGPASIHGFIINSQNPPATKTNSGVYVSNTGAANQVSIFDVTITGFQRGIYVSQGMGDAIGNALIRHDTHSTGNTTGLRVDNGAQASVNVTAAAENMAHAEFNSNDGDGISIASGTVKLTGQVFGADPTADTRTVRSDMNGGAGLSCFAACNLTASFFSASGNKTTTAGGMTTGGMGVNLSNAATATFHNCVFENNATNGVYLYQSTGGSLTNISFGKDPTSDPGLNRIVSNTQAGICVDYNNTNALNAEGDDFGSKADCSTAGVHTRSITAAASCKRALDIAGANGGSNPGKMVNYMACSVNVCNNVFSMNGCPPAAP